MLTPGEAPTQSTYAFHPPIDTCSVLRASCLLPKAWTCWRQDGPKPRRRARPDNAALTVLCSVVQYSTAPDMRESYKAQNPTYLPSRVHDVRAASRKYGPAEPGLMQSEASSPSLADAAGWTVSCRVVSRRGARHLPASTLPQHAAARLPSRPRPDQLFSSSPPSRAPWWVCDRPTNAAVSAVSPTNRQAADKGAVIACRPPTSRRTANPPRY